MIYKIKRFSGMLALFLAALVSCEKDDDVTGPENSGNGGEQPVTEIFLSTDKARYDPGEEVEISVDEFPSNAMVRYKHLNEVVDEENLSSQTWTWTPPSNDFRGYMLEVFSEDEDGEEVILGTVAIDVSSDWARFPRYGFLSKFGDIVDDKKEGIISNLNRYHINGLQFYDWHYKPHAPLAMENGSPQEMWRDIIDREIYFSTVEDYINLAHQNNMKAMYYNLAYGALDDYEDYGIGEDWFLYNDRNQDRKDRHELPQPPFISDIYLTDPSNPDWLEYLKDQNDLVYENLAFDGFHIDQLGSRDDVYDYSGNRVDLPNAFGNFIDEMKQDDAEKSMVMNAVDQYAQENIANEEVDFLYTEVWSANSYGDLTEVITDNYEYSNNEKQTVLAAYMNYDLAENTGQFNTPGVLLTDAVIFAFGGAHLELGEHMLGKEYFPNSNLSMSRDLQDRVTKYYDFMTAYENLLRDGGDFNYPDVSTGDGKVNFGSWPPQASNVAVAGKRIGNKQVIHLLNFSQATTMNWRDNEGNQASPTPINNLLVNLQETGDISKVWFASPDFEGGASMEIEFSPRNGQVLVRLPYLEYWSMIVVEYN
ncbi:endo-dextranase [Salegentibacter flavus]|uniref:Dextranase n=1 Tax=Salegentibacter flavus TaxID=287099 RepID=A0A1I5AEF5_9FLAO|nr:glycoside hydrolase family 66 protein [Salegentibacter flavus]SFN60866.1 dextranase [Salegentibacter flavus]